MSKIDLHIHSKYSDDGEFSIKEIMDMCLASKMELIAITDHNSVKGVTEALKKSDDIRVLSGIELDCIYKEKNFHLLGYGFDHTRTEFEEIEQDILQQECKAAEEKIRLFQKASGVPVNIREVMDAADGGIVTGELIAEIALIGKDAAKYEILRPYLPGGAKSDMPYVRLYWDFFSQGKPAYVPIHYLSLPDAIKLIHHARGVTVLAHPGQNLAGDYGLLADIISEGIDGLEAFSSYHTPEETAYLLDTAKQNNLVVTCGSDFHGKNKPNIRISCHGASWSDEDLMAQMPFLLNRHKLL